MLTLSAVGAIAGLTSGLFGIGGGSVMVPVLFYAFMSLGVPTEVVMHCAVATSSSVIIVNAIRSVRSHHSHGAVDWDLLWPKNPLLSYALWIGVGAFLGAIWLAPRLSGQALILIFAGVATLVALKFIFAFSMGYVNLLGFLVIAAIAYLTIPLGAKLAHKLTQKKLKMVFGICLLLVAANMARKALF